MEAAVVAVAFVLAGWLISRGFRGERREAVLVRGAYSLPTPGSQPVAAPLALASVVPGQPPLRIFASRSAAVSYGLPPASESGPDYTLTLAPGPGGRWSSVLRAPEVVPEGGALTVTLVVPWSELAQRYSAVNLVVR